MAKLRWAVIVLMPFVPCVWADESGIITPSVQEVREVDGSPSCFAPVLEVSNATLTDNSSTGKCTITNAGGSGNSFETIAVPAGASVVADSSTDTLTITETSFLTITGTAATDTIDITQITTDLGTDGLIAANAVALATDTTGNYVAAVTTSALTGLTGGNVAAENTSSALAFDYTATLAANPALAASACVFGTTGIICEGATDNLLESLITVTDPTVDRTLTIPDADSNPVRPLTCSGTDKVSAVAGTGVITCSADSGGAETNSLEVITTGILSTEIPIGTAADTVVYAALSGDVTMTNGGAVTIGADKVALATDTTGNYVAAVTTSVLTGLTGGNVAAENTTSALAFDYSQALTGDVGLAANATVFGVTGLVAEGATADTIELFLAFPDPATTDKTITFFNATDTIVGKATTDTLTNKTLVAADNVLNADTAVTLATARTIGGTSFDGSANIAIGALTSTNVGATTSLEFLGVISNETGSGALVFGTAPDLTVSATTETNFEAALDIAGDVSSTGMATTVIGADKVLESHLKAVDAAADEECLTFETTTGDFEWQTCGSGTGDITDVGNCATGACFGGASGTTLTSTTSEVLDLSVDATLKYTRNDAGVVTFMGADNADPASTTYDTSGAGAIVVGSADVTSVTVTTDGTGTGEFVLPAQSIEAAEVVTDTLTATQLAAALTFADGDYLNLGSVSITTTTEGLTLPGHATDCSTTGTTEGQVCWEADANTLYIGNGATVTAIGSGSDTNADKEFSFPASSLEPLEAADSIPPLTKTTGTNVDEFSLSYDAATDEGRKVSIVVPGDVQSGSTITFKIYWWSVGQTTNNVVWDVRHQLTGADGETWDAALTTITATCAVAGTVKQRDVCTMTQTLTNLGWAAGDHIEIMVYRDANNASDNMTGDAELEQFVVIVPRA